ncbi:epoxide hydrolase [Mycobacterium tuberculosis]|nr:epoxide hydrolase [Mycobacterium tuberculosis]
MAELTETSPETPETTEAIRAVEAFLNALQNEDFDTVDAALGDDLVYENVGFSRIRGGRRTATLLRRMQGRVGFEVKIHRIGADGAAVLTERTDALIIGPLRVQFWVCGVFEVGTMGGSPCGGTTSMSTTCSRASCEAWWRWWCHR